MLKIEFQFQTPEEAIAAIQAISHAAQGSSSFAINPAVSPVQMPAAQTVPVAPSVPVAQTPPLAAPVAPPPAVPTAAAPTYNRDQIMTAGAALIDAGKINELMGLLGAFGVQAVTQLGQEQLGAFATELRKLGAQI